MIEDCTALILAGGDSRRMGRTRQRWCWAGRRCWKNIIATMQQLFPKVIVSVRQPRVGVDVPQVSDFQRAGGPLVGLISGLKKAESHWVICCGVRHAVRDAGSRSRAWRYIVPGIRQWSRWWVAIRSRWPRSMR